jgi:hypothetical protein
MRGMKQRSGFSRIKRITAANAILFAVLAGGSLARATSVGIPIDIARDVALWTGVGNNPVGFMPVGADYDAFGINDASLVSGGITTFVGALNTAMILFVDGSPFVNPDSTVDVTADSLTTDTVTIVPGLEAQIRYNFFSARPVVRGLFSLTNTSSETISVNAAIAGDYGSDASTTVRATSDGDFTIDDEDFWYITDDFGAPAVDPRKINAPSGSSDPRITLSRYGVNASVVPVNGQTPENVGTFLLRYTVTIGAGQTVRIMVFMEMSDPTIPETAAVAAAADFESLAALQTAGLLTGITPAEQSQIVNYGQLGGPPPVTPIANLPFATPGGLAALLVALGGVGVFEFLRRKKREHC